TRSDRDWSSDVCSSDLLYVTLLELGLAQAAISLLYEPIVARRFEYVSSLILALRNGVRRMVFWGALLIAPIIAVYAWLVRTSVRSEERRCREGVERSVG